PVRGANQHRLHGADGAGALQRVGQQWRSSPYRCLFASASNPETTSKSSSSIELLALLVKSRAQSIEQLVNVPLSPLHCCQATGVFTGQRLGTNLEQR